jgi:chromate reductase
VSRIKDPKNDQMAYEGKAVGLLSASPGRLGGIRAVNNLRGQMLDLGSRVHGANTSVSEAHTAFDEDGSLINEATKTMVEKTVQATINLI